MAEEVEKEGDTNNQEHPEMPDKNAVLDDLKNSIKDLPKGTKFLFSPIVRFVEKKWDSLSDEQKKNIKSNVEKVKKEVNEGFTDLRNTLKSFWDSIKGKDTKKESKENKEAKNEEEGKNDDNSNE